MNWFKENQVKPKSKINLLKFKIGARTGSLITFSSSLIAFGLVGDNQKPKFIYRVEHKKNIISIN